MMRQGLLLEAQHQFFFLLIIPAKLIVILAGSHALVRQFIFQNYLFLAVGDPAHLNRKPRNQLLHIGLILFVVSQEGALLVLLSLIHVILRVFDSASLLSLPYIHYLKVQELFVIQLLLYPLVAFIQQFLLVAL